MGGLSIGIWSGVSEIGGGKIRTNDLDEGQKQLIKTKSYHESIVVDILVQNDRKIML